MMTDVSKWVVSSAIAVFSLSTVPNRAVAQLPNLLEPEVIQQINIESADLIERMRRRGMTLVYEFLSGSSRFELWKNPENADYWLLVWEYDPRSRRYDLSVSRFETEQAALAYFDCYYVGSVLPSCSREAEKFRQSQSQYLALVSDMQARNMTRVQDGQGGFYDTKAGRGENYRFELWATRYNDDYWLFVWDSNKYPNGPFSRFTGFSTSREALDYFDCQFARKPLPVCPNP